MKKFIFVQNALQLLARLAEGKRVEGVLYVDQCNGRLTFKAYNRQPRQRLRDVMIEKLPWGWVKGSLRRNKRFTSVPNDLSLAEQLDIMDRENEMAKQALIEQTIFCN